MKNLSLTAGQRLGLEAVLAQQTGNLGELAPLWRTMEKLRITETEATAMGLRVSNDGGALSAQWDATVAPAELALEDADAARVLAVLVAWPHFKPSDLAWAQPIKDALASTVVQ